MSQACEGTTCCTKTPLLTHTAAAATSPLSNVANFLPAGTLSLQLQHELISHSCGLEDWHLLPDHPLLLPVDTQETHVTEALTFLHHHNFIYATCKTGRYSPLKLIVRIYLIPYDLPSVHGRLRVRDEATVLAPARQHFKLLLPRIIQDSSEWELDNFKLPQVSRKPFFSPPAVSLCV